MGYDLALVLLPSRCMGWQNEMVTGNEQKEFWNGTLIWTALFPVPCDDLFVWCPFGHHLHGHDLLHGHGPGHFHGPYLCGGLAGIESGIEIVRESAVSSSYKIWIELSLVESFFLLQKVT